MLGNSQEISEVSDRHCLEFRHQLLPLPRGDEGIIERVMRLAKIEIVRLRRSLQPTFSSCCARYS